MTQPQRGSARTEVRDLRNIVDRLDLLMGTTTAGGRSPEAELGKTLIVLTERVEALETEVEELRTLVNHLMTIATWQAKVTATLVGEEAAVDDGGEPAPYEAGSPPHEQHESAAPERSEPDHRDDGVGGESTHAPALDEDIDDILGTGQKPSARGSAPPDFGI